MTSRTSPVGVVVLAVAGMFAIGCTAQTSVVFEALLEPASALASPQVGDGAVEPETSTGPTLWPHPDGYELLLPGGWAGAGIGPLEAGQLMDAMAGDHPGLAERAALVLDDTGSQMSMVGADMASEPRAWSVILIVSQPTDGRKKRIVKIHTYEAITALPGLRGPIIRDDVRLPNQQDGVRYDYTIDDEDLGAVRVRSYLFRFGGTAYLVSFVANESTFEASEDVFDAIVESIRFGV